MSVAGVLGRGLPSVLIRPEVAMIECKTVVSCEHSQSHRSGLFIYSPCIDIRNVFGVEVGCGNFYNSPVFIAVWVISCIVNGKIPAVITLTGTIDFILNDSAVAILTDKVNKRFVFGNTDQFVIDAVLYENQVRSGSVGRDCIDSRLYRRVVACTIGCYHSVECFCMGARTFHRFELQSNTGEWITAHIGNGTLGNNDFIGCPIRKSRVGEADGFTSEYGNKCFPVEGDFSASGLYFLVESEHDISIGRGFIRILHRRGRYQHGGCEVGYMYFIGIYEYIG